MINKLMGKIIKMCKSEPNMEIKFPVLMKGLNETDDEYRKRIREYTDVQQDDKKQVLIKELSYLVDLGDTENEIYDNLQALLEVLRVQEIISNEAYEQAEIKVSKIWGFNTNG